MVMHLIKKGIDPKSLALSCGKGLDLSSDWNNLARPKLRILF